MVDLIQQSVKVILAHQLPSGAYPACPTMPDYQFCWFRDGSFIAHAILLYGQQDSALRFHGWVATVIERYREGAQRAMAAFAGGQVPDKHDVLRARYTYEGGKGPDDWPEFQLDGLGTWLWSLKQARDRNVTLSPTILDAATFVADYLAVLWPSPCHDLWEEFGDHVHTYTLAAIYAGLASAADLLERPQYAETATKIQAFLNERCLHDDHGYIKSVGVDLADGSLTALGTPYHIAPLASPTIAATIRRVEADLYAPGVGVHRYRSDVYYGGGAWLLLVAWLGWYYAECGAVAKAREILDNIARYQINGELPEQIVPPMLATMADYDYWVRVRGTIATPLLWSHAMYLILAHACQVPTQ